MKEIIKAGETGLFEGVIKAAREAGHQLIRDGQISEDTQKAVSKPLMPRDTYYKAAGNVRTDEDGSVAKYWKARGRSMLSERFLPPKYE